jgi:hypothetical protein
MAAWIGGGAAWISGADNGRRRRRGRPGSAEARRGSAAAQPRPAALTTAGGGGEGGRRWAAATFGSTSQVCWGARVVGWAEGRKRRQIHVRPEKVGTSFCLHFVLFSSRDIY